MGIDTDVALLAIVCVLGVLLACVLEARRE